jgi:ribonuclease H / adenosylcobalamin/alpha-ribazole phosphatase
VTTRLLLCRHAATDGRGRICGSYDVALSPEGEAQAQALARALTAMRPTAVYSSPLRRARDTAATISEPVTVADLREVDFGDFEGLTAAEAEALDPATFAAWTTDPSTVRFPGGGCYGEVAARVCAAAARLRRRHRGETIVVVTHDGPLRALLAHALGLGASDAFRLELRHCGVSVVDWHGNVPAVRLVNADPATLALGALRLSMRD